MERRQVLAALGALATASLAGCGGSGGATENPPTGARVPSGPEDDGGGGGSDPAGDVGKVTAYPSFEATDFSVYNASGDVLVEVVVQNPAEQPRTMVLNVSSRTDSGLVTNERELSMDPGTSQTVNVTLPVAYDEWGGNLDFQFRAAE